MSQPIFSPTSDWLLSWQLSEAEALPFCLAPATPLPPSARVPMSFADSSVSRPHGGTDIIHTASSLRKAGFKDKWTIKDAPIDEPEDAAGDAALAAWGEFLRNQSLTTPPTIATGSGSASYQSSTTLSSGPSSYSSLPVDQAPEQSAPAPRKRTRVPVACSRCRKAQKKCEGGANGETCASCAKKGHICVYEPITKAKAS